MGFFCGLWLGDNFKFHNPWWKISLHIRDTEKIVDKSCKKKIKKEEKASLVADDSKNNFNSFLLSVSDYYCCKPRFVDPNCTRLKWGHHGNAQFQVFVGCDVCFSYRTARTAFPEILQPLLWQCQSIKFFFVTLQ